MWVNNQVEPAYKKIIGGVCGNNRFHKSAERYNFDIKHGKKPLFFHKLYRHCTGFSEYVLGRHDSKQMAFGEPKHALWQSLKSVHI